MTKKELIKKIDELAERLDMTIASYKEGLEELKHLHTELENLPHEEDEIED